MRGFLFIVNSVEDSGDLTAGLFVFDVIIWGQLYTGFLFYQSALFKPFFLNHGHCQVLYLLLINFVAGFSIR